MKTKFKVKISDKIISLSDVKTKIKQAKNSVLKKSLSAVQESYYNTEKLLNKGAKAVSRLADEIDDFSYNTMRKAEKFIEKKMDKDMSNEKNFNKEYEDDNEIKNL